MATPQVAASHRLHDAPEVSGGMFTNHGNGFYIPPITVMTGGWWLWHCKLPTLDIIRWWLGVLFYPHDWELEIAMSLRSQLRVKSLLGPIQSHQNRKKKRKKTANNKIANPKGGGRYRDLRSCNFVLFVFFVCFVCFFFCFVLFVLSVLFVLFVCIYLCLVLVFFCVPRWS